MSEHTHAKEYLNSSQHKVNARTALAAARAAALVAKKERRDRCIEEYTRCPTRCAECGVKLPYEKRSGKFCSRSCSATNTNKLKPPRSDAAKQRTSQKLKGRPNPRKGMTKCVLHEKTCLGCNLKFETARKTQKFCTAICYKTSPGGKTIMSESARTKMANRPKRSKNEILFGEMCAAKFENVHYNTPMFNGWDADVIIEDVKVAVLWNGKWHYEKITHLHSVDQVQNRDRIKLNEIKDAGYEAYVIKDLGSFSKQKVMEEFNKFITWVSETGITHRS